MPPQGIDLPEVAQANIPDHLKRSVADADETLEDENDVGNGGMLELEHEDSNGNKARRRRVREDGRGSVDKVSWETKPGKGNRGGSP